MTALDLETRRCETCDDERTVWHRPSGALLSVLVPCPTCSARRNENADRCPTCGGKNPGDVTHTRC